MTGSIDFDGINAAARCAYRDLLPNLIPGGKFIGDEYVARNPCRGDQHAGSFKINFAKGGVWADFASDQSGKDFVSLFAYLYSVDQGEAARQLAATLGLSFRKQNGHSGRHRSASANSASEQTTKLYSWGHEGPPMRPDELRRHYYPSVGVPAKVKIKRKNTEHPWSNCYRVFIDGVPAGWQWKKPDDYRAIPYVSPAIEPFDPELIADEIFWPEGEKDVDTLSSINLPAFTFGGTGDGLPEDVAHYLKDRRIVILSDNDPGGRHHAEEKAVVAHAAGAASIKIVHFDELENKDDVSVFIERGGTAEQLLERIDATSLWSPATQVINDDSVTAPSSSIGKTSELVSLADIKPEATDWLWHHRIPRGAQTISTGWPGVGKSQLQCDIVARASTGTPWPDGSPCPCGDIIMLTCEDSFARTVIPRLLAAGADLTRIHALPIIRTDDKSKRAFLLTEDLDELERHLLMLRNAVLVTIDPITGFLGSGRINSNSVTDIRGTLAPLSELAERHNIAVHTITHPPKTTTSAMNAFIGSQAFIAASRMAYLTTEEMDEEGKPTGRFLMAMVRSSLGPKLATLAYRLAQTTVGQDHRDGRDIIGSHVVWDNDVIDISANAALAAASRGTRGTASLQTAKADCIDFLQNVLANGWVEVADIAAEAVAAGLHGEGKQLKDNKPMRDARRALKVETHRDGFGKGARYLWALSGTPWVPSKIMGAPSNGRAPMDQKGRT